MYAYVAGIPNWMECAAFYRQNIFDRSVAIPRIDFIGQCCVVQCVAASYLLNEHRVCVYLINP